MARLSDCELKNLGVAYSYPPVHVRPEPAWDESRTQGTVPDALYYFYTGAGYFSLGSAPPFLNDPDRVLFSYLKSLVKRNP